MKRTALFCFLILFIFVLTACGGEPVTQIIEVTTAPPVTTVSMTTEPTNTQSEPLVSAPILQSTLAPLASDAVDHDAAMEDARQQAEMLDILSKEELTEFATPVPDTMQRALTVNGQQTELPALNKDGNIILPLRDVGLGLDFEFGILPGTNGRLTWNWSKDDREFSVAYTMNANSTINGITVEGNVEGLAVSDIYYEDGTLYATVGFVENAFGATVTSDDISVAVAE